MEPFEFEGDEVTDFTAQLPSATLEAPEAYPRGTVLNLTVQVRVKSVRLEEDRKGNLARKHILALEDVTITDVLTPEQRKALIAAATAQAEAELVAATDPVISEEAQIEDVLPGQTTIEEQIAELGDADIAEQDPAPQEETAIADRYDTEGFFLGEKDKKLPYDDDEDDHQHDWMDEEEETGLRVEVGF